MGQTESQTLVYKFKRENPELYEIIMKYYSPVFDKTTAIEMYLNNEDPPCCEICNARLLLTKKRPKKCVLHCKSILGVNLFTYDMFIDKFPGVYKYWDGFKNGNDFLTVTCPKHNEYEQVLNSRIAGYGCQQCYFDAKLGQYRIDQAEYLRKFNEMHGDLYDYSLVKFCGAEGKIDIICKVPDHGIFSQAANVHAAGHGCSKCMADENSLRNSTDEAKAKRRVDHANYIKNNPTKNKNTEPELKCKAFLNKNNIEFEHQYIVLDPKYGAWTYDFYLKDLNLLIETDGEYYHRRHESLNRDKIKNKIADQYGYNLLRLSDLNLDFSMIFKDMLEIKAHTINVMDERIKFVLEKYGDVVPRKTKKV